MKTILLAGGLGTRLSEYTDLVPKPMVTIGGKPILWHIMNSYAAQGHKDFYVALGYKAEIVKEYFLNYRALSSNFTVNLGTGQLSALQTDPVDWQVTLVDTGADTLTGGRVKRLASFVQDETFMLTYGDGLSNVNIEGLLDFHRSHGRLVTVTAVHPAARFGELTLKENQVTSFSEKPQVSEGWINGGYFVCEPDFLDLIAGDHTVLEKEPLEKAAALGELMAYCHDGFWQCMDTKRDRDALEALWESKKAPWRL
jgi:glucose-1-phosphate cytidylyltransferase